MTIENRGWRIDPAGDRALLVRLGSAIDPQVLAEVLALEKAVLALEINGLQSTLPAYASLLCGFDPNVLESAALEAAIRRLQGALSPVALTGAVTEIPTHYDGPDLSDVAERTRLSVDDVIEIHADREYLVYCVGFAPGYTYCGELDPRLNVPRKPSPRARVVPGTVAIAGRQTGIYAVESPGGWNLIGRTDLSLFDPRADPPVRFKAGDRLRFVPQR